MEDAAVTDFDRACERDPYNEGWEAFLAGYDEQANPYDDEGREYGIWLNGWNGAAEECRQRGRGE